MSDEHNSGGESGSHEPRAKISKESLMSQRDDTCPSCGADMPGSKATVCVKCGYDMKANRKVRTKVSTEEIEEPGDSSFCRPGKVHWKALLGFGAVLMLIAFVLAWGDPPTNVRPFFYAIKTLVYEFVHFGLGVVAVITTAMLLREKVGQIEYGVAWMSIAIGAFFASIQVGQLLGANPTAQWIVGALLGGAVYLGVLWLAFRTSRDIVLMIAGLQFVFWLLLWVYGWVEDLAVATGGAAA